MTGSTRNAYGSLQRLREDTEKNLRDLELLVAASVTVWEMDVLRPYFDTALTDLRAAAGELRADLDLLTDETSRP